MVVDARDPDDIDEAPLGLVADAYLAEGGAAAQSARVVAEEWAMSLKVKPTAVESERLILATIMRDNRQLDAAIDEGLVAEEYAHAPHAIIFRAMFSLRKSGAVIDEVTVRAWLDAHSQLTTAGRDLGVVSDAARSVHVVNAATHVRMVREKAALRFVTEQCTNIVSAVAMQKHDPGDIILSAESDLARLRTRLLPKSTDPVALAIANAKQEIASLHGPRRERTRLLGKKASDLMARPRMGVDWLVRGVLARKAVTTIAAMSKGTKTWVGTELMIALSTATPLFGQFPVPEAGASLAIYVEDGESNLQSRMQSLARGRRMDPKEATALISYEERVTIDILDDDDFALIVASARAIPNLKLLYLDPLRDIHEGEENSSDDMSRVMHRLQVLRNILGCNVIAPHHMGRPSKEKAGQRLSDRMRGSTAIHGALDGGIYIETKNDVRAPESRRWETLVDVDLRDGSPTVGMFSLSLDVKLVDGSADIAGWAFYDDADYFTSKKSGVAKDKPLDEQEVLRRRLVDSLRLAYRNAQAKGTDASCGADSLALFCKSSNATVKRRLEELVKANVIGRAGRGWVYIPQNDEPDEEDDDT